MKSAVQLAIRLLGTPDVQAGGAPLDLNHQKARALLYYLAATGRPQPRDHLATLLWSESTTSSALHSLRSTLYHLRRALRSQGAGDRLDDGDPLRLDLRPGECDVTCFRELTAEKSSLPAAARKEKSLPAAARKEKSLPAAARKEKSLPAAARKEKSLPAAARKEKSLPAAARKESSLPAPAGKESALEAAVALYRGPFLQGLSVANAPLFEEWVRLLETETGQAFLGALERLAAMAEARQDEPAATGYLRRIVEFDPLDERAQQRLIRTFLRQGAVGLALRQYQQLELTLRHELDIAPSAETLALVREALQPKPGDAPTSADSAHLREHPPPLPLAGRDDDLNRLLAIGKGARAGPGVTVLLEGENGIGKTRLVDELADRLAAAPQPFTILRGACLPFDDLVAYGPFIQALQNSSAGDLTGLVAEPEHGAPDGRGRFFSSFLQALRTLTPRGPVLLVVDDLQWATSETLHLFGLLAMRLPALPVMLVGTAHRIEAIPALSRLVALGRPRRILHLVSLAPLSLVDVEALLRALSITPASAAPLAGWLRDSSGGSPFVLAEILAQLRSEGILVRKSQGWRLDATRWLRWRATSVLPETSQDLVAWRLSSLAPAARNVLDVLAVAGHALPFDLLREYPGVDAAHLVSVLEDLAARHMVELHGQDVALPHMLLRQAILRPMSQIRRRTMHAQLAEVLERAGGPAIDPRQIALHAVAGEDVPRARRYALDVLGRLPGEQAGAETVAFVRHLYDLLLPAATPAEKLTLTQALGRLHQSLGDIGAAKQWHRQSLEVARTIPDLAAQATAYFELAEAELVTNDYRTAIQCARDGLAACAQVNEPFGATMNARGHRLLGAATAMEGSDLPGAESYLRAAAGELRNAGNLPDLCATLFELGNVAAQRGDLARALDLYQEAGRAAESGRAHYYLALARNNQAYHSLLLGDLAAARGAADASLKLAEAYEMFGVLLYLYSTRGEINLYVAEWEAAVDWFQRGLALAEELGSLERQAGYRAGLGLAARGRGDPVQALQLFDQALALIAGQGYWDLQTRLQLWLGDTLLRRGRPAEAEPHITAALATAREHGRALWLVEGERLHAGLLAANGDWPAADALYSRTEEQAVSLKLPIPLARTRAAWGESMRRHSPDPDRAHALLDKARATFSAHDARAELQAMQEETRIAPRS